METKQTSIDCDLEKFINKDMHFGPHPVLHELFEQCKSDESADYLISILSDPKYDCLFDTCEYIDKYGMTSKERMIQSYSLVFCMKLNEFVENKYGYKPYMTGRYSKNSLYEPNGRPLFLIREDILVKGIN
jgi:hypothetical protein